MGIARVRIGRWAPALLMLAAARAQAPQEGVLRVTVNLVQVDAVVTGADGRHVTDLKPEDFEIRQDGKLQKITYFSYIRTAPTATPAAPARPPNMPPPAFVLRPEQVGRTIAIVVDDIHISFEDMVDVRRALSKYVEEQIQPGDLAAIIRTGGNVGALQQFTTDKRLLNAAVARLRPYFLNLSDELDPCTVYNGLRFILNGLRDLPGRKSVVLFSSGIPAPLDGNTDLPCLLRALDSATRASVPVNIIDARGAPTLAIRANEDVRSENDVLYRIERPIGTPPPSGAIVIPAGTEFPAGVAALPGLRTAEYYQAQEFMRLVARESGGLFLSNSNDLNRPLMHTVDDMQGYYLIGYTPAASTFNQASGQRWFHKIAVKAKRKGLTVRTHSGFSGQADQEPAPLTGVQSGAGRLLAALLSPFGKVDIKLDMASLFFETEKQGASITTFLHIDGGGLAFKEEPGGPYRASGDIVMMVFGDNGQDVVRRAESFEARFQGQDYQKALDNGFVYSMNLPIKTPGAYQVRVVVRDKASDKIGTANQFVEIPDVKQNRLALSGVVLRKAPPEQAGELSSVTVLRLFQPADPVIYGYQILNARLDRVTNRPQLESAVRLYREDRVIYAGKPAPVEPESQADPQNFLTSGGFVVGPGMKPGDYLLEVSVTDKLADRKYATATQWMDFQVAALPSK